MNCKDCGESMEGDGYTTVVHCPRVDVSDITPDCDPVHCGIDNVDETILIEYNLDKIVKESFEERVNDLFS